MQGRHERQCEAVKGMKYRCALSQNSYGRRRHTTQRRGEAGGEGAGRRPAEDFRGSARVAPALAAAPLLSPPSPLLVPEEPGGLRAGKGGGRQQARARRGPGLESPQLVPALLHRLLQDNNRGGQPSANPRAKPQGPAEPEENQPGAPGETSRGQEGETRANQGKRGGGQRPREVFLLASPQQGKKHRNVVAQRCQPQGKASGST